MGRLEHKAVLLRSFGERDAKLEELDQDSGEVLEEGILVFGILVDVRLEGLVGNERHIGWQHHQRLGLLVLILFWSQLRRATVTEHAASAYLLGAVPLAPTPLLIKEQLVVLVGHNSGGEGPRALETAAVGVAASESVGTTQGHNLLVVETHAVEDVAQVLVALSSIGETSVGRAVDLLLVNAARSEGHRRALHLLDSYNPSQDPEIRGGDPGELS